MTQNIIAGGEHNFNAQIRFYSNSEFKLMPRFLPENAGPDGAKKSSL
jgi:hypothetical protein